MSGSGGNVAEVDRYYNSVESRWVYRLLVRGRKHCGYYPRGRRHLPVRQAQERMEDELARRLDLPAGSRVVDAGSGEGLVACRLAEVHGLSVVGIEALARNRSRARANARKAGVGDRVSYCQGSYDDLPLAGSTVDGLYTMETVVHAPDVRSTLRELARVLRPGGRIACFEYAMPQAEDLSERVRRDFATVVEHSVTPGFAQFVMGHEAEIFAEAGFVDIELVDLSYEILPMMRYLALLGHVPYRIAAWLGQERHLVNATILNLLYMHRRHWRYFALSATKPL